MCNICKIAVKKYEKIKGPNNTCKLHKICTMDFLAENIRPGITCNMCNICKIVVHF